MFTHVAGTVFGLIQVGIIAAVSGLVKLYSDVQTLKRDMDAAHKKLRDMEKKS